MAKYNHIIEDWWRHLGTYDREQVSHYPYKDFGEDTGWYLSVTDEWWDGLTDEDKAKIYEDFFDES